MSLDFYHSFKYPVELPATLCDDEEENIEEMIWHFLHPEESLFDDSYNPRSLIGSSMLKYFYK